MTGESVTRDARYCLKCGGDLELRTLNTGEPARLTCVRCGFVFYLNPKVAASAIFCLDNGIVLVRRDIEPSRGKWSFPGGFVDLGETAAAAAVRETLEETGLRVTPTGILDVYSSTGNDVLVVVYAADLVGGEAQAGAECSDVSCFPPESLPWDELAFESTQAALRDYVRRFFPRVRVPRLG
jgi:8-oxo-dGTP diphosphatase